MLSSSTITHIGNWNLVFLEAPLASKLPPRMLCSVRPLGLPLTMLVFSFLKLLVLVFHRSLLKAQKSQNLVQASFPRNAHHSEASKAPVQPPFIPRKWPQALTPTLEICKEGPPPLSSPRMRSDSASHPPLPHFHHPNVDCSTLTQCTPSLYSW